MRSLSLIALAVALALAPVGPARAAEVRGDVLSPAALIAQQRRYDGETVRITGEAIGEALRADDGTVWVNVLGEGLLLGVVIDRASAEDIRVYGDYGHRGDQVLVEGEFSISCTEHPGETDIHVTRMQLLSRGETVGHPVPWPRVYLGAGALVVATVLGVLYRRREHRAPSTH